MLKTHSAFIRRPLFSAMQRLYVINTNSRYQPAYHTVPHNRPLSYKNWSEKQIDFAVKAVRDGHSHRSVAEEYGIPRSTLGDHIRGKMIPGAKSGNPKYLNDAEETELLIFCNI